MRATPFLAIGTLLVAVSAVARPAVAAEAYDNCAGFIDTLPAIISTQGVWCLRKDLATNTENGTAIAVHTNNVTIDCNGFKLGNLAASDFNLANGVQAADRSNVTVRGCNVRGFGYGVFLSGGSGHVVEDNRFDTNRAVGVWVAASTGIVRRNYIVDTISHYQAIGVVAYGNVEVLDNSIDTVSSDDATAYGIALLDHENAVARSNRIHGVTTSDPESAAVGIFVADNDSYALIADNFVASATTSPSSPDSGVRCLDVDSVVRDNTFVGFQTPLNTCTNDGGNVTR